jgi:hypothetical protein
MTPLRSRILFLITFLILSATELTAQAHQRDHWYFGLRAGLKFTNTSVEPVNDGRTSQVNATACMSDDDGNLLFYTDGNHIWNRDHQVMENGDDIDGYDGNYAQQVVIVHHPGDANIFYVLYVSERNFPTHLHRLKYSIVNMSVDNGVVDVKNVTLPTDDILVKIAAVEQTGERFWVITQGDRTGKYFAFTGTRSGIDATPVVTDTGVVTLHSFDYGELRFSPDGKTLAATNAFSQRLSLFKFDFNSGALTDPLFISADNPTSIEFAPAGKLMYVTSISNCSINTLYQYDISSYSQSAITNSRIGIGNASNIGMLQRGPDNIIYVGRRDPSGCNFYSYIGTIGSPDVRGIGAVFNAQSIHLQTGTTFQGLPNFSIVTCADYTTLPANISVCNEPSYTIDLSESIAELRWDDGSIQPVRKITHPGVYTVESTVGSCRESDFTTITFTTNTANFSSDTVLTFNFPVILSPVGEAPSGSIAWQDNSTGNTFEANEPGNFSFTSTINSCINRDTIVVGLRELFIPNVITVNNDGKNDFFVLPFMLPGEHWQLRIYNRYGVQIFSAPSYQNTWQLSGSQVCYYRLINLEYNIDVRGVIHVL